MGALEFRPGSFDLRNAFAMRQWPKMRCLSSVDCLHILLKCHLPRLHCAQHVVLTVHANLTCRLSHLQELRLGLQMQVGAPEIGFPLGVLACRLAARTETTALSRPCCHFILLLCLPLVRM